MKATLEVQFATIKQAKQAVEIINQAKTDGETRAKVKAEHKENKIIVTITADDFTALRALTTTVLRDLKVIIDGFKIVGESSKRLR